MGRYAQQRRKGGGGTTESQFTIAAPSPADWTFSAIVPGEAEADIVAPGSAPTSGFTLQTSVNGSPFSVQAFENCLNPALQSGLSLGDSVQGQIAWADETIPEQQSDWSASKTVIIL